MTTEERQKLRDAALAAVNSTRARSNVHHAALAEDWKLQTSNSFRRIGTLYGDGDVLCGTKHPIDAHPDLLAAPGVLDYVIAAQPRVVLQLLDDVEAAEAKLQLAQGIVDTIGGIQKRLDVLRDALGAAAEKLSGADSITIAEVRGVLTALLAAHTEIPR